MKRILTLLLVCCAALSLTACGGTSGTVEVRFPETTPAAPISAAKTENTPPESPAPSTTPEASPGPAEPPLTAPKFLEAFLSAELALFDTLVPAMRANPETQMDAVYLNDASPIRNNLKAAAALWADDAAGTGDTRTRTFNAGSSMQDGKPVPVENTFTARYEGEKGRLTIAVIGENGKPVSRTECVQTPYGYIAQHYDPGDSDKGLSSLRILISLRDADGMIGMEADAPAPEELSGAEAFELPETLRVWFALSGRTIKIRSEQQGADTEFEAGNPAQQTDVALKMPDQSYLGDWRTADGEGYLTVSEITEDAIQFNLGIFRMASIDGIATSQGNAIKFAGEDPAGNPIYGTLKFSGGTIVLTIDEQNWAHPLPEELTFTIRE